MERKLTKNQAIRADIEGSVEPMALRMSGQLLLGVTRIYSRKAKYLLDDCNDALFKLKTAFRPGQVDLTTEQLMLSRHALTVQDGDGFMIDTALDAAFEQDLRDLLGSQYEFTDELNERFGLIAPAWQRGDVANTARGDFLASEYAGSEMGEDLSLEVGRRDSSRAPSIFGGADFFGGDMSMPAISARSDAPRLPEGQDESMIDIGRDMAQDPPMLDFGFDFDTSAHPGPRTSQSPPPPDTDTVRPRKTVKFQRAVVDTQIENPDLAIATLGAPIDVSAFTIRHPTLPLGGQISLAMTMTSGTNLSNFFMPTTVDAEGRIFAHAPTIGMSLAPELEQLFNFQIGVQRQDEQARKRRRVEAGEDVEVGRRVSLGDTSLGFDMSMQDDFLPEQTSVDYGLTDMPFERVSERGTPARGDRRSLSMSFLQPEAQIDLTKYTSSLMVFDSRAQAQITGSPAPSSPVQSSAVAPSQRSTASTAHLTAKAREFLQEQLPTAESTLSMHQISEHATKRAASSFFFELLVLSSRNQIKIQQEQSMTFGDIQISPKQTLYT